MNINESIIELFERPTPKVKAYNLSSCKVVVTTSWNPATEELIINVMDEPKKTGN